MVNRLHPKCAICCHYIRRQQSRIQRGGSHFSGIRYKFIYLSVFIFFVRLNSRISSVYEQRRLSSGAAVARRGSRYREMSTTAECSRA